MGKKKVLIVEDETMFAIALQSALETSGFEISGAIPSGEEALEAVDRKKPDLVIMDIGLIGEMNGIVAAEKIRSRHSMPILFITGYSDSGAINRISQIKSATHFTKPVRPNQIAEAVETIFSNA